MSWLSDRRRILIGRAMALTSIAISVAAVTVHLFVDARSLYSEWVLHNSVGGIALAALAWLFVSAQPRNRATWLFPWMALFQALNALGSTLLFEAVERRGLSPDELVPVSELGTSGATAAVLATALWVPGIVPMVTLALLWFPDGRPPSERWRPVSWLAMASVAGLTLALAWSSRPFGGVIGGGGGDVGLVARVSYPAIGLSIGLSLAALVVRYRGSLGSRRRQFRWIAWATGTTGALWLVANAIDVVSGGQPGGSTFQAIALLTFPLFCAGYGIAIWRHQLFDIDVIISRTLLFGFLAVFIGTVYVGVVFGLGTLIGQRGGGGQALSLVATVLVAFLFHPVRQRLERAANRLVYGTRATPYEVLSDLSGRLAQTESTDGLLDRMAALMAESTGAERAVVWRSSAVGYEPLAVWPPDRTLGPVAELADDETAVTIERSGERLGLLSVTKRRGDELNSTERRLLDDLAGSAGLVLARVRLDAALSEQATALIESRRRLIGAQDEERQRLERQLQTGTQQQLGALAAGLDVGAGIAVAEGVDPIASQVVSLVDETRIAQAEIGTLAQGVYPPVLEADGLTAAVESLAATVPIPIEVQSTGYERFDLDAELAVYFCIAEALTNVTKHAQASMVCVRLDQADGIFSFEASDDGIGFTSSAGNGSSTGLAGLTDRIEAVGGWLTVSSTPGQGTTIAGSVAVDALATVG